MQRLVNEQLLHVDTLSIQTTMLVLFAFHSSAVQGHLQAAQDEEAEGLRVGNLVY